MSRWKVWTIAVAATVVIFVVAATTLERSGRSPRFGLRPTPTFDLAAQEACTLLDAPGWTPDTPSFIGVAARRSSVLAVYTAGVEYAKHPSPEHAQDLRSACERAGYPR